MCVCCVPFQVTETELNVRAHRIVKILKSPSLFTQKLIYVYCVHSRRCVLIWYFKLESSTRLQYSIEVISKLKICVLFVRVNVCLKLKRKFLNVCRDSNINTQHHLSTTMFEISQPEKNRNISKMLLRMQWATIHRINNISSLHSI